MGKEETKTFRFEIKEFGDNGQLSGYLSTFGNIDGGGDVVERGAFRKTLQENDAFPLTWAHQAGSPASIVGAFSGREDDHGLWITGEFFDDEDSQKARRKVKQLYDRGIKIGLSIGYMAIKWVRDTIEGTPVRRLKELKLNEGALTLFPMNELALVDEIKAEWTTSFINELPDAAFAVIEPAYSGGDTEDKRARHLPHHGKNVKSPNEDSSVDLPHLRAALARMNQIRPVTDSISMSELRNKASAHLIGHAKRLEIGEWDEGEIELKPFPQEHACRLRDPEEFAEDTFRRKRDGTIFGKIKVPSTIAVIWGKLKGHAKPEDMPVPQALRFPVDDWTVETAKKWLKDNNIKYIAFEPASKTGMHSETEPPKSTQLTEPRIFSPVVEVLEQEQAAKSHLLKETIKILEEKSNRR